jgi:hypothetical protein
VRAKKGDGKGSAALPATGAPEATIATESPTAASAAAPASAIDAFAAFLAKDALNPGHRDEAEVEDSKTDKPAKKPRASQAAGRVKKA